MSKGDISACKTCGTYVSKADKHQCLPSEEAMRFQMIRTLQSLERMADAVTDHLTADKRPAETEESVVHTFHGDVIVKGHLTVEGCTTTVESKHETAPLSDEIRGIQETLLKHRKALAVVASEAQFKDSFFGTSADCQIASLVGLRSCKSCIGTGWIARDETCSECKRQGYMEV